MALATVFTFTGSPTQANASLAKPGPYNTGVPRGKALKVHYGDLTIRKRGTIIDGLDVRGYIRVRADNVIIRNSIVRGGTDTGHRALIMNWWGAKNLYVHDTTIVSTSGELRTNGISGANFVARRVQISGVVDPIMVIGNNVYIQRSWLRNTLHSKNDPNQRDGITHDDSVQVTGGWNVHVADNTLEGANNAAIMISTLTYKTGNIHIKGNWISGGACAINISRANMGAVQRSYVYQNRFAPGRYGKTCAMRIPRDADVLQWANRFNDGSRIRPVYFDSPRR